MNELSEVGNLGMRVCETINVPQDIFHNSTLTAGWDP